MYNSKITGLGYYLPENVVTNDDLSKIMDTTDEWIQERTGIKKRRWIDPKSGDTTSTMGAKASEIAIKRSGLNKEDIDFIIFATLSPDMYFPGGGVRVQDMLGMQPSFKPKFLRHFLEGHAQLSSAVNTFHQEVTAGAFPNCEEVYR